MTTRTPSAARAAVGAVVLKPHSKPKASNPLWRVAFGAAVVVQLIAVYAPDGPAGPQVNGFDKVVHVFIFAAPVLAALMMGISAAWVIGILALHAPVSELIQHLVLAHRDGDVFDVMADLGGVVLGVLAYLVWTRRQP